MANHRRRRSLKKLPASLVLGFTALSIGSPLSALLVFPQRVEAEAPTQALTLGPATRPPTTSDTASDTPSSTAQAVRATTAVIQKAKEKVLPTSKRPQTATHTSTSVLTSKPEPSVSTRAKPTVAQRQIQQATTSAQKTQKPPPSTTAPPKPPVAKRTTTPSTSSLPKTTPKSTSKPTPTTTKEEPPPPKVQTPSHQLLVSIAQKYVGQGIPYQMGGNSLTGGMDCSHFIWMVLKEAGYPVGYRDSSGLASWTTRTSSPQLGDLVLYQGHAGIYAGNGMMIDQGKEGGAFLQKVYTQNFIGYGRIPI